MAGPAAEATPQTSLCYLRYQLATVMLSFTEKYSPPAASSSASSCSKTSVKLGCASNSLCNGVSSFLFLIMGSCIAIVYISRGNTRSRSKKSTCCEKWRPKKGEIGDANRRKKDATRATTQESPQFISVCPASTSASLGAYTFCERKGA